MTAEIASVEDHGVRGQSHLEGDMKSTAPDPEPHEIDPHLHETKETIAIPNTPVQEIVRHIGVLRIER